MGNRYHALKINAARVDVGVGIAQLLLSFLIPLGCLGTVADGARSPEPIRLLALLASCCSKPPF